MPTNSVHNLEQPRTLASSILEVLELMAKFHSWNLEVGALEVSVYSRFSFALLMMALFEAAIIRL
jgi:hypothetical protein